MNLLDLSRDVLSLVADEIYKIRARRMPVEFKKKWRDKRPYRIILESGGRRIHEGRAFLSKDKRRETQAARPRDRRELYNVRLISALHNTSKYYICGMDLKLFNPRSQPPQDSVFFYNMQFSFNRHYGALPSIRCPKNEKIIELGKRNGWEDFDEQTKDTIIRYLMKKEDSGIKCY
jgi:hypothetical protein